MLFIIIVPPPLEGGGTMMILRGVILFPCYDLGGLWKISENDIEHRADQLKKKRK